MTIIAKGKRLKEGKSLTNSLKVSDRRKTDAELNCHSVCAFCLPLGEDWSLHFVCLWERIARENGRQRGKSIIRQTHTVMTLCDNDSLPFDLLCFIFFMRSFFRSSTDIHDIPFHCISIAWLGKLNFDPKWMREEDIDSSGKHRLVWERKNVSNRLFFLPWFF